MSIVPASRLSRSDLSRLSNNIGKANVPVCRDADAPYRQVMAAMNRSLVCVGRRVTAQHLPRAAAGDRRSQVPHPDTAAFRNDFAVWLKTQ